MDARIAELEFLSHLEHDGPVVEVRSQYHERFGLTAQQFGDLVLDLLCDGAVIGDEPNPLWTHPANEDPPNPQTALWRAGERSLQRLLAGKWPYMLRMTHAGRLRLARLRDELDRGRFSDPTGILIDERYLERDARVRLVMLEEGRLLCAISADLDGFKQVNTKLGHSRGTEVLRQYYTLLRDLISHAGGEVYRHGGDETISLVVLPSDEQAVALGETIRRGVEAELAWLASEGVQGAVTVSIGVRTARRGVSGVQLIQRADQIRQQAKDEGKNRVVAEQAHVPF